MYKCIGNWPLPIGALQDQCKQTMIYKYSNKHNEDKNPNWHFGNNVGKQPILEGLPNKKDGVRAVPFRD